MVVNALVHAFYASTLEGPSYVLKSFPEGYQLYDHNKGPVKAPRHDPYLCGMFGQHPVAVQTVLTRHRLHTRQPLPLDQRVHTPRTMAHARCLHGPFQLRVQVLREVATTYHLGQYGSQWDERSTFCIDCWCSAVERQVSTSTSRTEATPRPAQTVCGRSSRSETGQNARWSRPVHSTGEGSRYSRGPSLCGRS